MQAELLHLLVGEQREAARGRGRLRLVDLVIARHEQHDELALVVLAGKRLHRRGFGDVQELRKLADGMHARGFDLLHFRHVVDGRAGQALAHLVGRGVTAVAVHERRFAGFGQGMELAGFRAADLPGVGLHGTPFKPHARADATVCVAHLLICFVKRGFVGVEGVGILHDELPAAQKAEARADFVAELHLHLVQRARQVLVRTKLVAHQGRDQLLMRGAEAQAVVVTVVEADALGAVGVRAARFLPQLFGLQHGHEHFLGADAVHLLANDVLHLGQHALAQRKERVDTRGGFADEARAQKQAMARDFGVARIFLERGGVQLA